MFTNYLFLFYFLYLIFIFYKLFIQKNYKKLSQIILLNILLLSILLIYYNYCSNTETFIFDSNKNGPTVMILAGTHGNECGPSLGLEKIIQDLKSNKIKIKKGKVIIIPTLNKCGRQLNMRFQPQELLQLNFDIKDLNRNYAQSLNEEGRCKLSNKVQRYIHHSDFILDFHEGVSFNKLNPNSMGQTIYPGLVGNSKEISVQLKNAVNKSINSDKHYKYYDIIESWPEINGSLRKYCNMNNKKYILVEIAGQGKNQTENEKKNQTYVITLEFLKLNGIL
jgi:predicted deacylase